MTTDAIRKRRPATSHLLLYAIIAFFAAALAWAWATRLERTIHGEGRLVPSARLQVVSHLEGGIVAAIGVRAGDAVRPGQALLRLDDTLTGADVAASRAQLAALGARSDRLRAEVEGRAPGMGAGGVEGVVHASRLADLQRLTQEGAARTASATRAVAEAQAAVETRLAALDAVQRQRAMIAPLVTRGLEPRMTLVQLDGEAARARTELAQAETSVARMRAAVTETQAGLARARQEWRAQAAGELASVDADLTMRRSTAPALADRLRRTVVRAPVAGRVNRVLVATTGSAVAPGAPLVEIVPDGGPSVFDVHVAPADIAFVHMGQRAQINLTAYESAVYGAIDGKVVGIAPDTVTDERSGQTFYVVRVAAGAPLRDAGGRPLPIGPGMTADVALLGDRRSVLDYLLTPISRLQRTAFRE